jgi:4'-phosphopantetheinyl transferase
MDARPNTTLGLFEGFDTQPTRCLPGNGFRTSELHYSPANSFVKSYIPLGDHDLHIWMISLDSTIVDSAHRRWLSQDERQRAARFRFRKDASYFAARRVALRHILSSYLDQDPQCLAFELSEKGKPRLAESGSQIEFNCSHSANEALLAVTKHVQVGVDIEQVRELANIDELAAHSLSCAESRALQTLTGGEKTAAFFRCWTRKEAFVKARGDGMTLPFNCFDVSLLPGEPAQVLDVRGPAVDSARWTLSNASTPFGFIGAVAMKEDLASLA